MEWIDEGIVLGVKRHGETSAILELMTREHGRHLGLVRGGAARGCGRAATGQRVQRDLAGAARRASRPYMVEGIDLRAGGVSCRARMRVYGVTHLAALVRLLPEREPHAGIHAALEAILDVLDDPAAVAPMVARFELAIPGRARFRPRSRLLRGDRRERRSRLRVAEVGPRGLARRRRAISRKLMRPARFPAATTSRPPRRRLADAFALDRLLSSSATPSAARPGAARRPRPLRRRRSCSQPASRATRCSIANEKRFPRARGSAGDRAARGAGGALSRLRALHHHAPRAS